ncbi:hypothetical protein K8I61_09725 [bacterium]|nr:hypothetical protein [bacterium]
MLWDDGEGTDPDGLFYALINVEPGSLAIDVNADGNHAYDFAPFVPAGGALVSVAGYDDGVYTSNPTGTWCTE